MGPTHGWWCGAVTWPTKCLGCSEPVFFFQCNCGSKVFFDELGAPWPIHDCETSWTRSLIRVVDESGGIAVHLSEGVTVRRPPSSFDIDGAVIDAGKHRQSSRTRDPIIAVEAEGSSSEVTVVGNLREIANEINVVKALHLREFTAMTSGFLGPLGKGIWGKVTIHEPSASEHIFHSYTVWVKNEHLRVAANSTGITVSVEIEPYVIPSIGTVWICSKYEVLG